MTDKYLNPEMVAKMLDVSPSTVRAWLRNGDLKGMKLGGGKLWRIKETDVEEFLYKSQGNSSVS